MYRIALVVAGALVALVLAACAATPVDARALEERFTADELEAMYSGRANFCERYRIGRLQTSQKCRPVDPELREKIKAAWQKLYHDELTKAPACIREHTGDLPRPWVQQQGFDPDSETLGAELVARGVVIGTLVSSDCSPAVCEWQTRHHPQKPTAYCKDPPEAPAAR